MQPVSIVVADPMSPGAQFALRAYTQEVASTAGLKALDVDTALADVAGFCEPDGTFLLAVRDDTVVGCAGLRSFDDAVGEVKRMWVSPAARGQGVGALLLRGLEQHAMTAGYTRLVLDTHRSLAAAVAFYLTHGYERISRYNDNPDATDFFAKNLT